MIGMEDSFAVILVAGLAVFGLFWVASQELEQQPDTQQMEFVEKDFGTVGEATQDYRTVDFGEFTVGEGRGLVSITQRDRATISNSLTSTDSIEIEYNATAPRTGSISFEVLGKAGTGAVYVKTNDAIVFEEKLVTTGTPEINISEDKLKPGMNNIEIGARKDGVFSSTTYTIEDLQVYVDDRKFSDYKDTFRVYQHEVSDFVNGNLSFTIPLGSSTPSKPLKVHVNDRRVFRRSISRSTQSVEVNPQNADLAPGLNTIEFSTEGEARYEVENADINLRYIGQVSPGNIETSFEMDDQELNFAEQEDTSEVLNFAFRSLIPSTNEMEVQINDHTTTITPDDFNSIDLPEGTLKSENQVNLRSNGSYQVNEFKILSSRDEEGE